MNLKYKVPLEGGGLKPNFSDKLFRSLNKLKAQVFINRHIMAANKKATKETGQLVDEPAIAVKTYKGSIYCKEVEFIEGGKLIQNGELARCSGATIWIEVDEFESLIIDGKEANRFMFEDLQELDLEARRAVARVPRVVPKGYRKHKATEQEDYFWQFVEDFKANKNENYIAIAERLSPRYGADKKALSLMFKELHEKLKRRLNRHDLELGVDDFDQLIMNLIDLGKKDYYSVLKNPRSAMYLTDPSQSCYYVLDLMNYSH